MPDIPIIPLEVLVSEDAEGAQVPFPPVGAYDEGQVPKEDPAPRVAKGDTDNWNLRNLVFEQASQVVRILVDGYTVASSKWRRNVVAGGKLARASEYLELARKELEA